MNTKLVELGAMHVRSHETMRNTSRARTHHTCVRTCNLCLDDIGPDLGVRVCTLPRISDQVQDIEEEKKKPTTRGIPRRSPIQVLTPPDRA